jgi:PAS domain S-box-containing protein/putative nucleotidyltransferase with HDIG domain
MLSHKSTILIVDDDAIGRDTLAALLDNQNYRLAQASGGAAGLELAASLMPDVMLLDVMMPEIDGFEVCRRIRMTPALADIVVIIITALDDRNSRLRGIEAGADDFITKPFDRIELRARLQAITRLNRGHRLALERAKFERVVDLSPNGIMIVDAAGNICLANPAMSQMLGATTSAELIGRAFRSLIASAQFDQTAHYLSDVLADPPQLVRFETELIRADNTRVPVEIDADHFVWDAAPAAQIVVRDITERKQAEARTYRQIERLAALRIIDAAITSSLDLTVTLNIILDQAVDHLQVDAAAVLLCKPSTQTLEYVVTRGLHKADLPQIPLYIGESCAGYTALHRRIVHLPADTINADGPPLLPPFGAEFPSYYGVPLIIKGKVEGVLELHHRTPLDTDAEWLHFMETIAGQSTVAIEHAMLFDSLQRSNIELVRAYDTTLEGWARALEMRDKEIEGHAQRVTAMTMQLARQMGLDEAVLVHIRRGALLHDIGKMGIPDSILLKPGPLTDDEWSIMRQHPVMAYEMLTPVAYLRPALDIPYCHHERWDGSGYPRGLKDIQIPLAARIFTVVDVWDALCFDRPYAKAWPEDRAREHIRSLSGTHFDPQIVEAFLNLEAQGKRAARPRLLIVDDDASATEILRLSLCEIYTMFIARSGADALEILAHEEIAVILTDQRLPGLTGMQLLERAKYVRPSTLGIICSAYFDSATLVEALNLGTVRGFIHKPWILSELRQRVHEVAQQYHAPASDSLALQLSVA